MASGLRAMVQTNSMALSGRVCGFGAGGWKFMPPSYANPRLKRDQPFAEDDGHGIRAVAGADLLQHRGDVELGRMHRNIECPRDHLVGGAIEEQGGHLLLARTEPRPLAMVAGD